MKKISRKEEGEHERGRGAPLSDLLHVKKKLQKERGSGA
jgi:hypothetical protein